MYLTSLAEILVWLVNKLLYVIFENKRNYMKTLWGYQSQACRQKPALFDDDGH